LQSGYQFSGGILHSIYLSKKMSTQEVIWTGTDYKSASGGDLFQRLANLDLRRYIEIIQIKYPVSVQQLERQEVMIICSNNLIR